MKATTLKMAAIGIAAAFGLFAFTAVKSGSIKGTVSPATSVASAIAISGMDTVKATIDNGSFTISDVKPGTYKLVIVAMAPYKNFEKEGVMVTDDKSTDVGLINLQQ